MPTGYVKLLRRGDLRPRRRGPTGGEAHLQKFEELLTVHALLRYLVAHDIRVGVRVRGGENKGELEWHAPNQTTLQNMLKTPSTHKPTPMAGAGVIPARERQVGAPRAGLRPLREGGVVLLKDRRPAYISWETYEKNLGRLRDNRAVADAKGAPRDGNSLLQGLVVCGHCGARMTVNYHGSDKRYSYVYPPEYRLRRRFLPVPLGSAAGRVRGREGAWLWSLRPWSSRWRRPKT